MALQSTTAIATVTLQSSTANVTFSGIPNTYRDLILVANYQGVGALGDVLARVNGDANSNYSAIWAFGDGSSRGSGSGNRTGLVGAYTIDSSINTVTWQIIDYSATNKHKGSINRQSSGALAQMFATRWASTAAINSVTVAVDSGSFAAGSIFSLYGRIA
jgi:hypothetical protein